MKRRGGGGVTSVRLSAIYFMLPPNPALKSAENRSIGLNRWSRPSMDALAADSSDDRSHPTPTITSWSLSFRVNSKWMVLGGTTTGNVDVPWESWEFRMRRKVAGIPWIWYEHRPLVFVCLCLIYTEVSTYRALPSHRNSHRLFLLFH